MLISGVEQSEPIIHIHPSTQYSFIVLKFRFDGVISTPKNFQRCIFFWRLLGTYYVPSHCHILILSLVASLKSRHCYYPHLTDSGNWVLKRLTGQLAPRPTADKRGLGMYSPLTPGLAYDLCPMQCAWVGHPGLPELEPSSFQSSDVLHTWACVACRLLRWMSTGIWSESLISWWCCSR